MVAVVETPRTSFRWEAKRARKLLALSVGLDLDARSKEVKPVRNHFQLSRAGQRDDRLLKELFANAAYGDTDVPHGNRLRSRWIAALRLECWPQRLASVIAEPLELARIDNVVRIKGMLQARH